MDDYETLRDCWLSGQISEAHMQELMLRDVNFLAWMMERASATEGS